MRFIVFEIASQKAAMDLSIFLDEIETSINAEIAPLRLKYK